MQISGSIDTSLIDRVHRSNCVGKMLSLFVRIPTRLYNLSKILYISAFSEFSSFQGCIVCVYASWFHQEIISLWNHLHPIELGYNLLTLVVSGNVSWTITLLRSSIEKCNPHEIAFLIILMRNGEELLWNFCGRDQTLHSYLQRYEF